MRRNLWLCVIILSFIALAPASAAVMESAGELMKKVWNGYYPSSGGEVLRVNITSGERNYKGQIAVDYSTGSLISVTGSVCGGAKKVDGTVMTGDKSFVTTLRSKKVKRHTGALMKSLPRPQPLTYAILNWMRAERSDVTYKWHDQVDRVVRAEAALKGDYPVALFYIAQGDKGSFVTKVKYLSSGDDLQPTLVQTHEHVRFLTAHDGDTYWRPQEISVVRLSDKVETIITEVGNQSERFVPSLDISKGSLRAGGVQCK